MIAAATVSSDSMARADISILLVEDEPISRGILSQILARKYPGKKVNAAKNGKEGLEQFLENGADVVVTDLNMPVMDGIQMAREIRKANPDACIIALSAYNSMKSQAEDFETLFNYFLPKPVLRNHLFEIIEKCLVPTGQDFDE